jgi:hypothetical protein
MLPILAKIGGFLKISTVEGFLKIDTLFSFWVSLFLLRPASSLSGSASYDAFGTL